MAPTSYTSGEVTTILYPTISFIIEIIYNIGINEELKNDIILAHNELKSNLILL